MLLLSDMPGLVPLLHALGNAWCVKIRLGTNTTDCFELDIKKKGGKVAKTTLLKLINDLFFQGVFHSVKVIV